MQKLCIYCPTYILKNEGFKCEKCGAYSIVYEYDLLWIDCKYIKLNDGEEL